MPKGNPRKIVFPIRFTDGEYLKIKKSSQKEHLSITAFIRIIILKSI